MTKLTLEERRELRQRVKKLGSYEIVAERLGYTLKTLLHVLDGTNPASELFLLKLERLEEENEQTN